MPAILKESASGALLNPLARRCVDASMVTNRDA
jgi:hypothetical protein